MVEMGNSLIYFMVGDLGFEKAWSKRLAANNPNITLVECATGIERVELGNHVEHGHDHIHGDTDPHFWSSPRAVKIMTANMLEAVVKADPANEEIYRTNFYRFARQLDETDSLIQDKLAHVTSRGFIIYHPALAYFAKDYNLYQHSVEFQGKNPSPSQIKALVDLARREQINTLFIQKGFDAKNMEVIAREIGAEVFEIDPLNYEWDKELLRLVDILARDVDE